jgi:hypothetical protein
LGQFDYGRIVGLNLAAARAHTRLMLEQQPTFIARKNPGTGWGVDILWPEGETEAVKGFLTESDAVKWIAEHSKALQGNTNSNSPQTL